MDRSARRSRAATWNTRSADRHRPFEGVCVAPRPLQLRLDGGRRTQSTLAKQPGSDSCRHRRQPQSGRPATHQTADASRSEAHGRRGVTLHRLGECFGAWLSADPDVVQRALCLSKLSSLLAYTQPVRRIACPDLLYGGVGYEHRRSPWGRQRLILAGAQRASAPRGKSSANFAEGWVWCTPFSTFCKPRQP